MHCLYKIRIVAIFRALSKWKFCVTHILIFLNFSHLNYFFCVYSFKYLFFCFSSRILMALISRNFDFQFQFIQFQNIPLINNLILFYSWEAYSHANSVLNYGVFMHPSIQFARVSHWIRILFRIGLFLESSRHNII